MAATIYRQGIYRTDTQESYEVESRGYMDLMPKGAPTMGICSTPRAQR